MVPFRCDTHYAFSIDNKPNTTHFFSRTTYYSHGKHQINTKESLKNERKKRKRKFSLTPILPKYDCVYIFLVLKEAIKRNQNTSNKFEGVTVMVFFFSTLRIEFVT